MPITLEIIRASEFIRVDATEHLDFEASKKVLEGLALACRKRALDRAMLDLRELPVPDKPLFTPTQLAGLIGAFRAAGFTRKQRLAVLFQNDVHGGIRMFAFISKMRGLEVEAFDNFERAFHWLAGSNEKSAEEGRGVPLQIVRRGEGRRAEMSNGGAHQPVTIQRVQGARKG